MLWWLEHGEHEETVREQMRINKMPAPKWIAEKPELKLGLEFYWQAFWELSTCRDIGMAEGPIPWRDMNEWAKRHGLEGVEYDRFIVIIRYTDAEYSKYRQKKSGIGKPTKPVGKGTPKRPNPRQKKPIRSG